MKEKKFEDKFNYLMREAQNKLNIQDFSAFNKTDLIAINDTFNHLESQKSLACNEEIVNLSKYSSNFTRLDQLENAYAEKGKQKEFEQAKNKLSECLTPYNLIGKSFKTNVTVFESITIGAFQLCLNNIKDLIKEGKYNEAQSRANIETCFRYLNRNKNSNSKTLQAIIESVKQKY